MTTVSVIPQQEEQVTPIKKVNLLDLTRSGMREFFSSIGEKPFRADQMMQWIYHRGVSSIDDMTNLNKTLKDKLNRVAEIKAPEIAYQKNATDGTIKFALTLEGGQEVEAVWIPETDRYIVRVIASWLCVGMYVLLYWTTRF